MTGFLRGLAAYAKALPLIGKLGLWRYVGLTAVASLGVFAIVLPLFAGLGYWLVTLLHHGLFAGAAPWVSKLVGVVVFLGLLALGYLSYKHIILVVASPWMSTVARHVESHYRQFHHQRDGGAAFAKTHVGGSPEAAGAPDPGQATFKRSARLNLRLVARELMLSLPLLALSLIPGVNVVTTVLLLVVQSYFAGAGVLDVSLERTHDYASSLAYLRRHRGLATGIGAGFVGLMLTVVGVLVIPVWCAAAGAVAVHGERSRS